VNDQDRATAESAEPQSSPEDDSQSITAPTPEVGRHGDGDAGSAAGRSSPEDGSQSIDVPTPEVGRHSFGPANTSYDGRDGEPAAEPAKNQPGGEPAANQPGGEAAKSGTVPGTAQRDDRAEGDR
jgi:hypothetical protein